MLWYFDFLPWKIQLKLIRNKQRRKKKKLKLRLGFRRTSGGAARGGSEKGRRFEGTPETRGFPSGSKKKKGRRTAGAGPAARPAVTYARALQFTLGFSSKTRNMISEPKRRCVLTTALNFLQFLRPNSDSDIKTSLTKIYWHWDQIYSVLTVGGRIFSKRKVKEWDLRFGNSRKTKNTFISENRDVYVTASLRTQTCERIITKQWKWA